jgi:hypothetical protein
MRCYCAAMVAWRMLLVMLGAVLLLPVLLLLGLGWVTGTSSGRMRGCFDTSAAAAAASSWAIRVKEGLRAAAMAGESSSALTA